MNSAEVILEQKLTKGLSSEQCVLVVDDDPVSSYLVTEILEQKGIEVMLAYDGNQAIGLFNQNRLRIGLIIMDIRLPHINGYEATRIIKKKSPDTPIIALTAHAFGESELKCREAGCDEYLSKPFEIIEFLELIDKYAMVL